MVGFYDHRVIDTSALLIKMPPLWRHQRPPSSWKKKAFAATYLCCSFAQAVGLCTGRGSRDSPFVGRIMDWHLADSGHATVFRPVKTGRAGRLARITITTNQRFQHRGDWRQFPQHRAKKKKKKKKKTQKK